MHPTSPIFIRSGNLSLLVYPSSQDQSEIEFLHAVMELELILNFELDAKVSVIGRWKNKRLNIPSEGHIPQGYLDMIDKKQTAHRWIASDHAFDLFVYKPWSRVVYKSGLVVTRGNFELNRNLVSFLKVLEFQVGDLKNFLQKPNLQSHISNILEKMLAEVKPPYAESRLFIWICCLFERFCPPETVPKSPVSLPKPSGNQRRLISMLDTNGNGLRFLPETRKDNDVRKNFYYKGSKRLDIVNGRSLLDPSIPVTSSELENVTLYAISVLQAHSEYILEQLKPEIGLDRSCFSEVESVQIEDPALFEPLSPVNSIPQEVQDLIENEAKALATHISAFVSEFAQKHGNQFCIKLLEWMECDKEIEAKARVYYGKNRLRLKWLYIKMDESSRNFFDSNQNLEWVNFSFVNNFRKFITRIHWENNSFKVYSSSEKFMCLEILAPVSKLLFLKLTFKRLF